MADEEAEPRASHAQNRAQNKVAAQGDIRNNVIVMGSGNLVQTAGAVTADTPPATERIRLLFLAASPLPAAPLRLDEEARALDHSLRQSDFGERFELRQAWAVRVDDLQDLLLRHRPHIVHLSGHGSPDGELVLQTANGGPAAVSVAALSALFRLLRGEIRCVVLNACFSEVQAAAIATEIDCVVGMRQSISDQAALHFATAFYRALGYGESVQTAFALGCLQIDLHQLGEADRPRLLGLADPAQVRLV